MNDSVDIVAYTKNLGSKFTGIRQIWLFGSRANVAAKSDSDWDLMVFADEQTFREMSVHPEFKHPMIDLLVVKGEDEYAQPWPDVEPKHGHLTDWSWRPLSETEAEYLQAKEPQNGSGWYRSEMTKKMAIRLWPTSNQPTTECTGFAGARQ